MTRPVTELPVKLWTVIVPNDGYEAIEATANGNAWYAREAMLGVGGHWHGVWRPRESGGRPAVLVGPEHITLATCKVATP